MLGSGILFDSGLVWTALLESDPDDPTRLPLRGAAFTLAPSRYIADNGTPTTPVLEPPAGKVGAAFTPGFAEDSKNPADAVAIPTDDYTELEWALIATAAAVAGVTYEFRVTKAGVPLDTYTVTPRWTMGAPGPSGDQTNVRQAVNRSAVW